LDAPRRGPGGGGTGWVAGTRAGGGGGKRRAMGLQIPLPLGVHTFGARVCFPILFPGHAASSPRGQGAAAFGCMEGRRLFGRRAAQFVEEKKVLVPRRTPYQGPGGNGLNLDFPKPAPGQGGKKPTSFRDRAFVPPAIGDSTGSGRGATGHLVTGSMGGGAAHFRSLFWCPKHGCFGAGGLHPRGGAHGTRALAIYERDPEGGKGQTAPNLTGCLGAVMVGGLSTAFGALFWMGFLPGAHPAQ